MTRLVDLPGANMGTGALDPAEVVAPDAPARVVDLACPALDVTLAVVLLVVLLPLMVVIAVAIRLESPGPVLFRQRRLGRAQAPFNIQKFRTMKHGAADDVHREFVLRLIAGDQPPQPPRQPRFKLSSDDRVTRVGRFLRRTSLDELPQLWNVVRGDMSLVGPRPPIPYEVEHYPPPWFARFSVKPGITGLWQVSGRSELTVENMVALDIEYVRRRSLRMNLWILLRTVPAVLSLRGAG